MEIRDFARFIGLLVLFNALDILSAIFWLMVHPAWAAHPDPQDNLIMAAAATVLLAIRDRPNA